MAVESDPSAPPLNEHRRTARRPGTTGRYFLAIGLAVVVVLAGLGVGAYLEAHHLFPFGGGEPTITIDTYDSLFGGCGSANLTALLDEFGAAHHAHISINCVAGTLSSLLISQKNSPSADLVIGLDEVTAPQADAAGVLVPYAPPALSGEPPELLSEIAPDHSVAPYEFGYLGVDYTPAFQAASQGQASNFSLPQVAANASWAKSLMIEDPETDIVGEEFLLSEIAFYEQTQHTNWTTFWTSVDPSIRISDSWSDAYSAFTTPPNSPPMLLSFNTDPAAASSGGAPSFNASLYHWNGGTYAWRTIYGIGIVKGTAHLGLDQAFEDWFLQGTVQSEIPTNEWVYPANTSIPLPPSFGYAADPSGATVLNGAIPPASIPGALPGWLDQWQQIDNRYGG